MINEFNSNNKDTIWRIEGETIVNELMRLVVTLPEEEIDAEIKVAAMEKTDEDREKWIFEYE